MAIFLKTAETILIKLRHRDKTVLVESSGKGGCKCVMSTVLKLALPVRKISLPFNIQQQTMGYHKIIYFQGNIVKASRIF
jgi:hypothetical protein